MKTISASGGPLTSLAVARSAEHVLLLAGFEKLG